MKHRFVVGWSEMSREKKRGTVTNQRGIPPESFEDHVTINHEEVFDDDCIPVEEAEQVGKFSTLDEACEQTGFDIPWELWEQSHLGESVTNRSPYVHRLRLIFPERTLSFYWWMPRKTDSSLMPDCFSVDPSDDIHSPWRFGKAHGTLFMDEGNQKHQVFAVSQVNTIEEAKQLQESVKDSSSSDVTSGQEETDLLSIEEAAVYAKVSEKTIRNWLATDDGATAMLPGAVKNGRMIRIPKSDLVTWRKKRKQTRNAKSKLTGTNEQKPSRKKS